MFATTLHISRNFTKRTQNIYYICDIQETTTTIEMGIVEAAERQKVALRLFRALRRTTNILSNGDWLSQLSSNWRQVARYQNFLGASYKILFDGLQWDANRRKANFNSALIETVLKLQTGQTGSLFEIQVQDSGSVWNYNSDSRLLRVNRRVWAIALDVPTQTVRVFEVWFRATVNVNLIIQSSQIPKLPQHISLTSPPLNSYFVIDMENNLTEDDGVPYTGINLIKLI